MSVFAGIVRFDGSAIDDSTAARLGRAITAQQKDRLNARHLPGALFVQRAGEPNPERSAPDSDRILFVAQARLDNRTELLAALGVSDDHERISDGALIMRMFKRRGAAGIARCLGAFVFALWNADERRLILGRDCLGNRALFFHRGHDFAAFATAPGVLLALPDIPREIDEITLANFLAVDLGEPRRTFYRGIERVPSRTLVTLTSGAADHRRYWMPDLDAPAPYRRDEDYVARARELFDLAVATATADTPRVAVAVSGGLDSSAIAATVARLGRAERISCYSLVPPSGLAIDVGPFHYLDERDKVESLAQMYPALATRFLTPEHLHPFDQDSTRYFARTGLPVLGAANLGPFSQLHEAALADGHRVLLIGSRGNFGLSWPGKLSLLALLLSGRWGAMAREARALARASERSLLRTVLAEAFVPAAPGGVRRLVHRLRGRDPDDVERFSLLNPEFVAEHDLVRQWRARNFDPWFQDLGRHAARQRAYRLFDHNQFGRDSRAVYGEQCGLELRDPHADRRLLEFLLAVPEPLYRRGGVPRSFARAVLADRLPPAILEERRRGVQAADWFLRLGLKRHLVASEIERLDASPLARRLIDVPRLKKLMEHWPNNAQIAQNRAGELKLALTRGVHVGSFIRWVEGGN